MTQTAGPPSRGDPPSARAGTALPVLGQSSGGAAGISRSADRQIAFGGLALAAVYLGLAVTSLLLPPVARFGTWLPAHLALAGAATTAIAAVLPFFTSALVAGRPASPAIRISGIALVAGGALGVMTVYAVARGQAVPAAIAGGSFVLGLVLVAVAAFLPLRGALAPRYPIVQRAYAIALFNVLVGATLATLLIGGNDVVGGAWVNLKPAHAWLNLVGFAGLVIVASLVHLAPTVVGARIRARASSRTAIVGLALGAPLVAAGYGLSSDLLARAGAVAVLGGGLAVAIHGWSVTLDAARGRWTTDLGWHRLTAWSLAMGQSWLGLGLALASIRVLGLGADPAAWSLSLLVGPLVVGGVIQVLVGAMTHLLPAIGPGDPFQHAAQRRILGRFPAARIGALNGGAALVTLGFGPASGIDGPTGGALGGMLVGVGLASAALGAGGALVLLAVAARRASS